VDTGGERCDSPRSDVGSPRVKPPALRRPLSHSDLGFRPWNDSEKVGDAGRCFGVDFGGTLSKIVFFEPTDMPNCANGLLNFFKSSDTYGESGVRDDHLSFSSEKMRGRIHFIHFETSHTIGAISMLETIEQHNISRVHATGGGAFKFSKVIKDRLGIRLMKQDELETVVRGIIFTLLEHPDSECYTFEPIVDSQDGPEKRHHGVSHVDALSYEMRKVPMPISRSNSFFPFLLVNIGSGVSIINVTGPNEFKRVSGTAIGGATYYGLCKLLCRCKDFDQAMDLAELGDSRDVNLTVQDIYGGSYDQAGLAGEVTASFFGKAAATRGHVRTRRSRKRPYVSLLERIGLVIIALLCADILLNIDSTSSLEQVSIVHVCRELLLVLMPLGIAYLVFWSGEAKLSSSHPPLEPGPDVSGSSRKKKTRRRKRRSLQRKESLVSANQTSFEEADIARALVVMVAQNVTQIAFLNARLFKSNRVLFTGNFLRHNKIALRALSSMMHNWSQGEIQALFMEHEGYFGAMGAFLHSCGRDAKGDEDDEEIFLQSRDSEASLSKSDDDASTDGEVPETSVVKNLLFKGEFPRRISYTN